MSTVSDVPPEALAAAPAPLTPGALARVPGVLGVIARQRAADYAGAALPARVAPLAPGPAFRRALVTPGIAIIAEIKRASPSRGVIAERGPLELARAYRDAGAAAISVLTEARHFGGALEHLRAVAGAVRLPLMRKDFVVHPLQLVEARVAGASAALLIAAVLGDALAAYLGFAGAIGLECLVEVHDERELALALSAGTRLLGANNRDLRSLEIDLSVAPRLLRRARDDGFDGAGVAESGYCRRDQVEALRGVADALLIGSSLAASPDPAAALAALMAPR